MQIANSKILLDIIEVAKKLKVKTQDLSWRDYEENGEFAPSTVSRRFGTWESAKKRASKSNASELRAEIKRKELDDAREKRREEILEAYISYAKENNEQPKSADLADRGITRDAITRAFGSIANLDTAARDQDPDAFKDVHLGSLFSPKSFDALDEATRKHKRFVVTTAVTGCDVHDGFYASLQNYCNKNDAALLILVASDPSHNRDGGLVSVPKHMRYGTIDKKLAGEHIVVRDTALNSNLSISTLKTSAKMIDPLTGTDRLGQRNGSIIIASPKQRQRVVPISNHKLPHVIMSTGAITKSDYSTENYMSERLAYLADNDHQLGAIIVEVEDDELFHFRQVQADQDGSFIDFASGEPLQYMPKGTKKVAAAAFVLGDWHSGETDPQVSEAWKEVASMVKPDYVVIHDGFNGLSINHHEDGDYIQKAVRAQNSQLSLEIELKVFAADLDVLSSMATKSVVVVKSNHDEFLERYLREARYVQDPNNHYVALKLALAMFEGFDPLQYAVEDMVGLQPESKVRWLKRSEDFKVARIQLGSHGDKGPNGAKGNLAAMEKAFGLSVTGHSHVPEILRGAWSVGTSSYLKLDYNQDSPSSWMNTSCIVYPNGQRQLVNVVLGKWRLKAV